MTTEYGSGLHMWIKSMQPISASIIKGQMEPFFRDGPRQGIQKRFQRLHCRCAKKMNIAGMLP
jgi:hypothetical protein